VPAGAARHSAEASPPAMQGTSGQARLPRLSESDPPAIARHERAGGGLARQTYGGQGFEFAKELHPLCTPCL
jgi:hypothetical protein